MSQSCATCIYGDGERCHWPYEPDDRAMWSPTISLEAPKHIYDAIEFASPERVKDHVCAKCDTFEERDEPIVQEERCPNTSDMFGGGA